MAEVAERDLNQYVENSSRYITYTIQFLNKLYKIHEPVESNTILFCFDAVTLYPSISQKEGFQACKEALNTEYRKQPSD